MVIINLGHLFTIGLDSTSQCEPFDAPHLDIERAGKRPESSSYQIHLIGEQQTWQEGQFTQDCMFGFWFFTAHSEHWGKQRPPVYGLFRLVASAAGKVSISRGTDWPSGQCAPNSSQCWLLFVMFSLVEECVWCCRLWYYLKAPKHAKT